MCGPKAGSMQLESMKCIVSSMPVAGPDEAGLRLRRARAAYFFTLLKCLSCLVGSHASAGHDDDVCMDCCSNIRCPLAEFAGFLSM